MQGITRRGALVGATAGAGLFSIGARAATYDYRFACNTTETHPLTIRLREAAAAIGKETNGQFRISVFPNSQLGSDTDTLSQLRAGAVQFFTLSGLILSTLVPVAAINGVGFAFPDYKTVWAAMGGKLGDYVRAAIDKAGLHSMPKIFDNGFRQITSSTHPIDDPASLANFKIRVPVAPLWTSMFQDFGASPVSINFNEVYSSLQTHVADGQENALSLIATAKLYEVQKYVSMTSHMWDGYYPLANAGAWARLPHDLQEVAVKHFSAAALAERSDLEKSSEQDAATLKAKGMIFNTPAKPPFREKLAKAGFYTEWHRRFGNQAWSLLEEYTGNLG